MAEDSDISATSSEESSSPRPGRYKGPISTYRTFIDEERQIAASLDKLRDENLSAHLYNAHSMKRRRQLPAEILNPKPWSSKDHWRKVADSEKYDATSWLPPKNWTAWPLPTDEVPKKGEQNGVSDGADYFTMSMEESQAPSHELEEIMAGLILGFAAKRFHARDWEDPEIFYKGPAVAVPGSDGLEGQDEVIPTTPNPQDELVSTQDHMESEQSEKSPQTQQFRVGDSSEPESPIPLKRSESPEKRLSPLRRPVVSADDEVSKELLKPSIRHIMTKLDQLLMSMHHARQTCLQYGSESESQLEKDGGPVRDSDDEDGPLQTTEPLKEQTKRTRGRPRKTFADLQRDSSSDGAEEPETGILKLGRPRKMHQRLEGESHQDMLIRIARLQKKPIPFFSNSHSSSHKKRKESTTERAYVSRKGRLGVRDWSEILGTAALVGFPQEVVARATLRCTKLFGEGMELRHLPMSLVPEKSDRIVRYMPDYIEYLGNSDDTEADEEEDLVHLDQPSLRSRPVKRGSGKRSSSINASGGVQESEGDDETFTFFCPFKDCPRSTQGFRRDDNLKSHLRNAHKLDKVEMGKALVDTDDEVEEGLHVDGFLKPIKSRGWRGKVGNSRKKKSKSPMAASGLDEVSSEGVEI